MTDQNKLRVLIAEDSEDDTFLIVRELKRGGYEPAFTRVETEKEMRDALEGQEWDIIISDYKMPRFSGLAALGLYKESGLDVPFIVVSGTIGEELAVEMMVSGAHDYVMKGDHLVRLVPAVQRELKEAQVRSEKRISDRALRENEEVMRYIINYDPNAIAVYDRDLHYIAVSKRYLQDYNVKEENIIGKHHYEVFPEMPISSSTYIPSATKTAIFPVWPSSQGTSRRAKKPRSRCGRARKNTAPSSRTLWKASSRPCPKDDF